MTEWKQYKVKIAEEALEELAELNETDLRDYSLGRLVKESNQLATSKGLLQLILDKEAPVLQSYEDRLNSLYAELDRRESIFFYKFSDGQIWSG